MQIFSNCILCIYIRGVTLLCLVQFRGLIFVFLDNCVCHAEWQTKCVEKCGHIAEWAWSSKYVNLSRIMFRVFLLNQEIKSPVRYT